MIRAEVHSDDHKVTASFDATRYFTQARVEEIKGLAGIGWGGDYEADEVARWMQDDDERVARVFEYLFHNPAMPHSDDPVGFECNVCEQDVARWVRENRAEWFERIWPNGLDIGEPSREPYYEELHGDA